MAEIVIADADKTARAHLRQILEAEGHNVREAGNGHDAEQLDASSPVDILIVDIVMPKQDGFETIRGFRERNRQARIIATFAGCRMCGIDFLPMALKLGADTTLLKPVDPEKLLTALGAAPASA